MNEELKPANLISRTDAQLLADYFKSQLGISKEKEQKLVEVLSSDTDPVQALNDFQSALSNARERAIADGKKARNEAQAYFLAEFEEKLKPCPFCGGPPRIETRKPAPDPSFWFVQCGDCKSYTTEFQFEDAAIEAWNRRDPPTKE